ncbi:LON peptidase substrate-binding domain-containing protein [Tomitella gaofuii]|uniref:LON peptidase substrate-binding domain-containing protein n=1 Tax=Tomitella gaofuii TaxID=2760083 RepID=UPI001F2138A1|nr:LON peptidase substrate-binding domain-containing protein [Tomitella gaofuii]
MLDLMQILPMFPLGGVALPGERLPLHIFEPRYRQLLEDCLDAPDGPLFGSVLIERGSEVGGGDARTAIGSRMRITGHRGIAPGRHLVECIAESRITVVRWLDDDPYPRAEVRDWPDEPGPPDVDMSALVSDIADLYSAIDRLAEKQEADSPPPPRFDELPMDPGDRLYALAAQVPMGQSDRQSVLAAPGILERRDALREAIAGVQSIVDFQLA